MFADEEPSVAGMDGRRGAMGMSSIRPCQRLCYWSFRLGERGHWIVLSQGRTNYAYQDLCGFCVEKSLKRDKGASMETAAVVLVKDRVGLNQSGEN